MILSRLFESGPASIRSGQALESPPQLNERLFTANDRPKTAGLLSTSFAEMRTVRIYNLCAITLAYVVVISFAQEAASAG